MVFKLDDYFSYVVKVKVDTRAYNIKNQFERNLRFDELRVVR